MLQVFVRALIATVVGMTLWLITYTLLHIYMPLSVGLHYGELGFFYFLSGMSWLACISLSSILFYMINELKKVHLIIYIFIMMVCGAAIGYLIPGSISEYTLRNITATLADIRLSEINKGVVVGLIVGVLLWKIGNIRLTRQSSPPT